MVSKRRLAAKRVRRAELAAKPPIEVPERPEIRVKEIVYEVRYPSGKYVPKAVVAKALDVSPSRLRDAGGRYGEENCAYWRYTAPEPPKQPRNARCTDCGKKDGLRMVPQTDAGDARHWFHPACLQALKAWEWWR
jgi:hypothetical protein